MKAPDTPNTTTGSLTNCSRLFEYSEMPALLNDEIDVNSAA